MKKNDLFNKIGDLSTTLPINLSGFEKFSKKTFSLLNLIVLYTILIFASNSHAQTTLVSPTGDGGFENGTTFAANGWTADTPAATKNQWFCGGAVGGPTLGFTGTACAYVTNNALATPPPHTYTTGVNNFSHLYRDITVSASETSITLNFNWIGSGNTTNASMRVYLTPTTFTPVNTAQMTATGVAPTGRIKIGLAEYNNQASWTNAATVTIPPAYAGTTFRLIFEWRNINSAGTQPPAAIDNISVVSSSPTTCIAPAQATSFVGGTRTPTTFPASFSGTASGYLVVASTNATPPSQPVDGTIYTAANIATIGAGLTFIQSSAALSTPGAGLIENTQYYYYIFAYNNSACTGGPAYNTSGPLIGSGITCPGIPTSVGTSGALYNGFTINWSPPSGGSSAAIIYTVQVTTDAGYTSNVAGSPFTVTAPTTTLSLTGLSANTTYYYRILAGNGCNSSYATGSQITNYPLCTTPSQANTFVLGTLTTTAVPATFSGTANNYLVIQSLSATPPLTPVNGTTYSAGNIATLGAGLTFVQAGTSTSIAGTGLASSTHYYYFIYAYNSIFCSGGPIYSVTPPLTGNGITLTNFNDVCAMATGLTSNTSCSNTTGSTIGATDNDETGDCTSGTEKAVWYKFTAVNTTHTVTVVGAAGFDPVIGALTTCGSAVIPTGGGCTDSTFGGGTETMTLTGLTVGNTYYIQVYDWWGVNMANAFTICITHVGPCSTPTAQPTGLTFSSITSNTISGSFTAASPAPNKYLVVRSTSATAPSPGPNNTSTYVAGSTFSGATVVSASNATTFTATGLSATTHYYFYVYSYNDNCTGGPNYYTASPLTNNVSTLAPPTNISCATATALPCGTLGLAGTTVGATNTAHGTACTMGNYGVWYTFTGDGNQTTVSTTATSGWDQEMSISSGSCGAYTNVACRDNSGSNGTESYTFTAVLGVNYYIYVAGFASGSTVTGEFIISRSCTTPPAAMTNDECINAIPITISDTCSFATFTNGTATASTGIPAPGCAGYSGGDVWFSVVVPANGIVRADTQSIGMTDGGMAFYKGTCGALTLIECDDFDSSDINDMPYISRTGLTPGITIYIRMWSYNNSDNGTFGLCVTSPASCTTGSGLGTSALGCPTVTSGGLGLSGSDPAAVNACLSSTCVDLEATYLELGQTTNYTVSSIPYNPPYQYGCLQNPVSVNVDDIWSPLVNLPFSFCYYGVNYNQCLIGSNGVLTFNTATYTPGSYSTWSFASSIPSTNLFKNTIFGVYHDIDPSKGGEVGWELITLNSGCRALVASWNNVPMFDYNNIYYTGMMVLYENTNIIEVYVKEKRIDDIDTSLTWNDGNAIIGLQNPTGTAGIAAPGRNGLDANWVGLNEAWRFTPAGPSITSIKWYEGSGTTGPVVGTTPTINVCPTATTTYTAEVSYDLCNGARLKQSDETTVTVLGSKTWNGTISSAWDNDNNWTPVGKPTALDCVIIPATSNNPVISGAGYIGLGFTLSVLDNATLTINSNNSLTITDFVNVESLGTFNVENDASLVQINDVVNTGDIKYKREASIRKLDYVYWSSPVFNFNVNNISIPVAPGPIYKWHPTVNNPNGGQGQWQSADGDTMLRAKGYIVRGPDTFTTTPATLYGVFTGIPNNGTITTPISRGNDTQTSYHAGINGTEITNLSDNNNLVGNPYPSAIRGSQFLFDNRTKIEGNIKVWTHGSLPAQIASPFYNTFIYNYSAGDYLTYTFTGTSCCPAAGSDLFIGAGQGFFIQMLDGPAASDFVTFNNGMRDATFDNSVFYRLANNNTPNYHTPNNIVDLERHRIWLDIIDANNSSDRTLVGYVEGATANRDSFFDANALVGGAMTIYSLIDNGKYVIQGRSLPFDQNDIVPLGVVIPAAGSYKIAIAALDGLFEGAAQHVYLEDLELGIIHNLRMEPYSFTAVSGIYNDRFRLRYTDGLLGINAVDAEDLSAFINDQKFSANATQNIHSIEIFDVSGKLIKTFVPKEKSHQFTDDFVFANGVYFAKIKLESGMLFTKKLINNL